MQRDYKKGKISEERKRKVAREDGEDGSKGNCPYRYIGLYMKGRIEKGREELYIIK